MKPIQILVEPSSPEKSPTFSDLRTTSFASTTENDEKRREHPLKLIKIFPTAPTQSQAQLKLNLRQAEAELIFKMDDEDQEVEPYGGSLSPPQSSMRKLRGRSNQLIIQPRFTTQEDDSNAETHSKSKESQCKQIEFDKLDHPSQQQGYKQDYSSSSSNSQEDRDQRLRRRESEIRLKQLQLKKQNYSNQCTIRFKSPLDLCETVVQSSRIVKCLIRVPPKTSFLGLHHYELYAQDDRRLIMTASKPTLSSKCTIYAGQAEIAQSRSNFSRTEYVLLNPNELSYIHFEANLFGLYQQEVKMLRPKKKMHSREQSFSFLKQCYENCELERVQVLSNRRAQRGRNGEYEMDFKTLKVEASNKNMILELESGATSLVFGKKSNGIYYLYVGYPLTLLQGFHVGLCCLDRKPLVN